MRAVIFLSVMEKGVHMSFRIVQYLIMLVFAAAVAACEPAPAGEVDPQDEIATAVEQIATAIVIDQDNVIPPLLTPEIEIPEVEVTPTLFVDFASPTPSDVLMPAATPVVAVTPLPTPTHTILPPTPVPTEVFTPSPAIPETGVLPSPTPEQTPDVPQVISPGAAEDGIPPEIALAEEEWPLANHDYNNSRAASNGDIFADNVNTLGIAWSFDIPTNLTIVAPAGSPLIFEGTVYYQDLQSNVYAINAFSGSLVWLREYNQPLQGPNGPAIGYGKVYVHVGDNSLRALDLTNGEELWSTTLAGQGGSHQPTVYGELVLTSTRQIDTESEMDQEPRSGWFYAIHHESGEIVWQRPAVQEEPRSDLDANKRGGAWFSPAIDPLRGMSYWGTGKMAALPEANGQVTQIPSEQGNLYSHSVVALDLQAGELMWSAELDPIPAFLHGLEAPPVLITSDDADNPQDMVIGAGRAGSIIAVNRDAGERIWEIRVGRHQNNLLTRFPAGQTIQIYPGVYGGIASPLAYAGGTLYAAVNHFPAEFEADSTREEPTPAEPIEQDATPVIPEVTQIPSTPTPPSDPQLQGSSELVAIDTATGAVLWTSELPAINFGGVTVINDVLFTTTLDGVVYAFERETGVEIWSAQAPAGLLSLPAIAGDTIVLAAFGGDAPFLFALRLGLGATPTPTPGLLPTVTPTFTPTITPAQPAPPTLTPTPIFTPSPTPEVTPTETVLPEEPTVTPLPNEEES
jgi:outer membrane protein assembly factor BamB